MHTLDECPEGARPLLDIRLASRWWFEADRDAHLIGDLVDRGRRCSAPATDQAVPCDRAHLEWSGIRVAAQTALACRNAYGAMIRSIGGRNRYDDGEAATADANSRHADDEHRPNASQFVTADQVEVCEPDLTSPR